MEYFHGNKDHPQHISVGAVLMNDEGKICCHHYLAKDISSDPRAAGIDDVYVLMRETLYANETLEHGVHRGLQEEFGATAEIVDYVGSIKSIFSHAGVEVEKTTLYFVCKLIDQDLSRRSGDIESKTTLEWQTPEFLIFRMKEQSKLLGRTDIDEAPILEKIRI